MRNNTLKKGIHITQTQVFFPSLVYSEVKYCLWGKKGTGANEFFFLNYWFIDFFDDEKFSLKNNEILNG